MTLEMLVRGGSSWLSARRQGKARQGRATRQPGRTVGALVTTEHQYNRVYILSVRVH